MWAPTKLYFRSWLAACLTSHLFVGLYTVDLKVPMQQKLVTLVTSCSCATGSASILAVRMGRDLKALASRMHIKLLYYEYNILIYNVIYIYNEVDLKAFIAFTAP